MLSDLAQVIAFCSSNCPSLPKYSLKRFLKWRPGDSILTFEGNGTMLRGISSVGTCKTICFYVLFTLRPEKYNFSKFRKYSRHGTWLARTWQLHSQCLLDDLAARALKIDWPVALQSAKTLIDHLKWKKKMCQQCTQYHCLSSSLGSRSWRG